MTPVISLNENAKKWVRALRSGLFQQGTQISSQRKRFSEDVKLLIFCCLGVACELAALDGVEVNKRKRMKETGNMSMKVPRVFCQIRFVNGLA
jgi:hypothetical protein